MRTRPIGPIALFLVALLVSGPRSSAQQAGVTRTELEKADLAGTEGLEGIVSRVEIAPGGTAPKHYHPGDTFVYVLQGTLLWESDEGVKKTFKPGDAFHEPPRLVHSARNGSSSEPVTVLVFFVKSKAEPVAVSVDEATSHSSTSGAHPAASPR